MSIKTNLIEDFVNYVDNKHVNFVDTTKRQNTYFKKIIFIFVITSLFLYFLNLIEYVFS